jgi:YHS domain-containing protein
MPRPVRQLLARAARRAAAATLLAGALPPTIAVAQGTAAPRSVNVSTTGVAVQGYDVVAYRSGSAERGSAAHAATWQGATYHFTNAAHREAFVAAPDRYAPQYGGWCAMGVAGGRKFDIDPTAFRIVDDKLYLNKDARTQGAWLRDVPGHIARADRRWPEVIRRDRDG